MPELCMYCGKDMSKWQQLDFAKDIVCDNCTQSLCGSSAIPQNRHRKPVARRTQYLRPFSHGTYTMPEDWLK